MRFGHTVGAALTAKRALGAAEAPTLAVGGGVLLALGALGLWKPAVLAYPMAVAAVWLGLNLLGAAWRVTRAPNDGGRGAGPGRKDAGG